MDSYDIARAAFFDPGDQRAKGDWFIASGGTETPFYTRTGRRLLYCWQPSTGRHAYLDLGSDIILTDEDAQLALSLS